MPEPRSIPFPLDRAVEAWADHPAIIWGTRRMTWSQLMGHVLSTTKMLKQLGVKRQDRVAVVDINRVECVIVLLALWRMGAVVCPFNPRLPNPMLGKCLNTLKVKLLLTATHRVMSARQVHCPKKLIEDVICFDVREALNQHEDAKRASVDLDAEATILLTSGSSDEPKAVVHSYANHYFNALGSNTVIPLKPGDRWLLSLPLYHVSGLGILFRVLTSGAAVVIPPDDDLAQALARSKATHASMVATQLYRLLNHPRKDETVVLLHGLSCILLGGSALPQQLLAEASSLALPVYLSYGLTEMASQVATGPLSHGGTGCVKVLPYRELKISADGEILVKGETLFKGYLKAGNVVAPVDRDGWFATGDLGRLDQNGCLTVTGRRDNMFISGGENIYPEEIERALGQMAGIAEAVVVPVPDVEFGVRPVAFIRAPQRDCSTDRIVKALEQTLPRFKIPGIFYRWPEEQEGGSLKVSRRFLKELAESKSSQLQRIA